MPQIVSHQTKLKQAKSTRQPHFRIAMLAIHGAMASSVTAPLDAFRIANALYVRENPSASAPFLLEIVSPRKQKSIQCAGGVVLAGIQKTTTGFTPDLLLIPGFEYRGQEALLDALSHMQPELELIQQLYQQDTTLAANCSGTFLLAAAGVLDGSRATTSWWLEPFFKRQFPSVLLDASALVCQDNNLITSGATTAMFSAVIRYIESKMGAVLAQNTARFLLTDVERQSQAAFVSDALIVKSIDPFRERVDAYLMQKLSDSDLSVDDLAAHLRMSPRTMGRRFRLVFHKTPQAYLQQLRIERAKLLLESSSMRLDEIISAVGYADEASFRKLFKRQTDATPNEYRKRFGARVI
jgi:transcriptional regulator GlxA family with amidase domain